MRFHRQYHFVFAVTVTVFLSVSLEAEAVDELSPDERKAVETLYELVKDDLTQEYQHEELYLIRWIRARNNDLQRAEEMFRKNLQWRKENRMDTILMENFSDWQKRAPFSFAYDREGRPALTTSLGQIDIRRIALAREEKKLDRYLCFGLERGVYDAMRIVNSNGTVLFSEGYLLFNMAGYSARTHACLACIPSWISLVLNYENNFPQLAKFIIAVNCPRIFHYLVDNFLRPLITSHTAQALRLYDFNMDQWRHALFKIFPENELLQSFGGTRKFPRKLKPVAIRNNETFERKLRKH